MIPKQGGQHARNNWKPTVPWLLFLSTQRIGRDTTILEKCSGLVVGRAVFVGEILQESGFRSVNQVRKNNDLKNLIFGVRWTIAPERKFHKKNETFDSRLTRWWFQIFCLMFTLILGEMIQLDEHIFQMGWFNHHLGKHQNPPIPGISCRCDVSENLTLNNLNPPQIPSSSSCSNKKWCPFPMFSQVVSFFFGFHPLP